MKKNLLLSITLCIGLMLPTASFGSESHTQGIIAWVQTLMQRAAQSFSSYMSQLPSLIDNPEYAFLYVALAAIPGLIYTKYRSYMNPKLSEEEQLDRRSAQFAYRLFPTDQNSSYNTPANINNIATFLRNEEENLWENFEASQPSETITQETDTPPDLPYFGPPPRPLLPPATLFNIYVLPTLKKLDLPKQSDVPQQEYRNKAKELWSNLIDKNIKQNSARINLPETNDKYLEIIKKYLQEGPRSQTELNLINSVTEALKQEPDTL